MRTKNQQTRAKMTREQMVKERRALKQEKKQAARSAKAADGAALELQADTPPDAANELPEPSSPL